MNKLWIVILICLAGCYGTVTPGKAKLKQATFDGNEQNSGLLKFTPDGALITAKARDRYNFLVREQGAKFAIPVKPDDGVTSAPGTTNLFLMDNEHFVKFETMTRWHLENATHP